MGFGYCLLEIFRVKGRIFMRELDLTTRSAPTVEARKPCRVWLVQGVAGERMPP